MYSLAVLLVLGSGFLHSVWNLYTKRSMNKSIFLWFCQIVAILIFLPWTIMELELSLMTSAAWMFILVSMLLHGTYVVALSLAPVSQLAPMREIGTVFGTILGIFILREQQGKRRIILSIVITLGVIVLGVWGGTK